MRGISAPRMVMAGWLLVVWLALWGRVDAALVAGGCAVVALTYLATRFPALPMAGAVRPGALVRSLVTFCSDLVVSSVVVGRQALRGPAGVRSGIVEVRFRTSSDLMLIMVANSVSLRPGSLVLEVDRERGLMYVHGMPVRDRADAERVRREVLDTEERLLRIFGPSRREGEARP